MAMRRVGRGNGPDDAVDFGPGSDNWISPTTTVATNNRPRDFVPNEIVDPTDRNYVHQEVKEVASATKNLIAQNMQRHGQNEQQIYAGIQQFGVSEQSKLMMKREKAAAEMANSDGIYGVFRNEKARHEINRDFCSRIGPLHKCFCGHTLAEHASVTAARKGRTSNGYLKAPPCESCDCGSYRYVPNEPEEVGDHWLSRRKDFVPGAWGPKCRCGHTAWAHDPTTRFGGGGGACNQCRNCFGFESHFACLVCDAKWEDHETIFETEEERVAANRPIKEDYIPLNKANAGIKRIVFHNGLGSDQIRGGGHRRGGARGRGAQAQLEQGPTSSSSRGRGASTSTRGGGPGARSRGAITSAAAPAEEEGDEEVDEGDLDPARECTSCGTPYPSATSKFCGNCGAKRIM